MPRVNGWCLLIDAFTIVGLVGLIAIVVGDHTRAILGALWLVGILGITVASCGFLPLLAIATAPESTRRRRVTCLLAGQVLLAACIGLAAYMVVPAHVFLGLDQTRGVMDPLWELHGEELAYAEQYRQSNAPAYEQLHQRVWREVWAYLRGWSILTAVTCLLTVLVLVSYDRRRQRTSVTGYP